MYRAFELGDGLQRADVFHHDFAFGTVADDEFERAVFDGEIGDGRGDDFGADEDDEPIKEKALEAVSRALEGLDVKKVIVIKGRLVNIVAK